MSLVALSIAVLLAAPLLAAALLRRPAVAAGLDGFVLVAVGGIVALHVVPQSAQLAGPAAVACAAAGLFLPIALHRLDAVAALKRSTARRARDAVLFVVLLAGIVVHALFDGVALASSGPTTSLVVDALALGVVLHRVPVGIALWVVARPKLGAARTLIVVATYAGGTIAGARFGSGLIAHASAPALAMFQAFVAGSILHIVAESPALPIARTRPTPVLLRASQPRTQPPTFAARIAGLIGSALAIATLWAMERAHKVGDAALDGALDHPHATPGFLESFAALALTIAPAAVLAFLIVGILFVVYPEHTPLLSKTTARNADGTSGPGVHGGGAQLFIDAFRGALAGLPHPLCSCAVAPLYDEIVDEGAPPARARAFLVAAPSLGVPALLLSARLLGVPFTAARIVGAALVAMAAGASALSSPSSRVTAADDPRTPSAPFLPRLIRGLRHGVVDAVDHIGPWLLLGVAVAAALQVSLDTDALRTIPSAMQIGVASVTALPLYLCAAGITPVAFVLLGKGASAGAVLAFLLVAPTTSLPTLALLRHRHGMVAAVAFAAAVLLAASLVGLCVDAIAPPFEVPSVASSLPTVSGAIALLWLALLLGASFIRQGVRGFLVQIMSPQHAHAGDDAHGANCAHDHGPALLHAPLSRVTLPFDPRGSR
jgi:uncharacterized membrane protein YraQ (UPF0718 family)